MITDDQRQCDICDEVIPRGMEYRVGWTTPNAVRQWFAEEPDPARNPTFSREPDATVRIDACIRCASENGAALMTLAHATIDSLR